tara:strand:+ start:2847 stop:4250 length:1404 start_codon:yes stop_codon:yes gene_type:complete
MYSSFDFANYLKDFYLKFEERNVNSGLFTFSIAIPNIDFFDAYQILLNKYNYSVFWEENNKFSFIALDKCKNIILNGPNRFKIAKKFNDETFINLINLDNNFNSAEIPRILYFFSFDENASKKNISNPVPSLEGVLPRILIAREKRCVNLRMNTDINLKSSFRESLEELWNIREVLIQKNHNNQKLFFNKFQFNNFPKVFSSSNKILKGNLLKGISLIKNEKIEKIVLASKLKIKYSGDLDIINILKRLKINQPSSCRYLWKRGENDITFGSSPEKLFSLRDNTISLEAIAGTTKNDKRMNHLLKSKKNLREHNLVIKYLIDILELYKVNNLRKSRIKIIPFGNIAHLSTSITGNIECNCPFELLDVLHPSPAVCGYPKKEALRWISTLESFDRDNYAAPIGWVDSEGDADFRVALRGARLMNNEIELSAGSGLVKGSICEEEIDEIKLKFESLTKEICAEDLINNF